MATKQKNDFKLLSDESILESDRTDQLEFQHTAWFSSRSSRGKVG